MRVEATPATSVMDASARATMVFRLREGAVSAADAVPDAVPSSTEA